MYNKAAIECLRQNLKSCYKSFYENRFFNYVEPLPLNIKFDPTLIFTNCSICHFKKLYLEDKTIKSYCTIQPALRTNTYKSIHDTMPIKYTASLEMLGAFSIANTKSLVKILEEHIKYQSQFLISVLPNDCSITIEISHDLSSLMTEKLKQFLKNNKISCTILTNNLNWDYGMDGIIGLGSNWIIKRNKSEFDFGNVIILFKDGMPIGVESGGSVELLIQSIFDFPHKIYANFYCNEWIANRIKTKKEHMIEYFDIIDVLAHILWITYSGYESLKLSVVLEKYIRALKCIMLLKNITFYDLKLDVKHMEKCYNNWNSQSQQLYNEITKVLLNTWNISHIMKNHNIKTFQNIKKYCKGFSKLEKVAILNLNSNVTE